MCSWGGLDEDLSITFLYIHSLKGWVSKNLSADNSHKEKLLNYSFCLHGLVMCASEPFIHLHID